MFTICCCAELRELVSNSQDVRLVFKHAPAASNPNSILAHEAALAAGAQGKFWQMHDLLFENQTKLGRADLVGYATALKLNMAVFQSALDRHTYRPLIERDLVEAVGLGVTTTPTFFVNGRRLLGPQGPDALQGIVNSVRDALPQTRTKREEIATPGPVPTIELDHAPIQGVPTASVTLVEFSDFECSYCAEMIPVLRRLLAAYPTQLRFAFKHYPLTIHPHALLAHEAALAAGAQGKFWEMHDMLFADHDKLTRDDLIAKAKQLNLDVLRFIRDLDSHRFRASVEADREEGNRLGVDGTPFFFVNGHAVSGSVAFGDFRRIIDVTLKEAVRTKPNPAQQEDR